MTVSIVKSSLCTHKTLNQCRVLDHLVKVQVFRHIFYN